MKHIIYIIVLITLSCHSQIHVVNQQQLKRQSEITPPPLTPPLTDNMVEEQAYLDAYFLPISQKENLQSALNTYGSVRLEKGDYGYNTTPTITIGSNQSIYGHPSQTAIPNVFITAGSTNVKMSNLRILYSTLEAGAPITNSMFKSCGAFQTTGGQLDNITFINVAEINFDCSLSGYFRNITVYRQQVQNFKALTLKGNDVTPSYAYVGVWSNYLTANGDAAEINNVEDITLIGVDAEGWNIRNYAVNPAMFYATNVGTLKMTEFIGGATYSTDPKPSFNIQADKLLFMDKAIGSQSTTNDLAQTGTDVVALRDPGTYDVAGGLDIRAHFGFGSLLDRYEFYEDNINKITTAITDTVKVNAIKSIILDTQKTPFARPNHETYPDPLGVNWATERIGKPDSRAYIQNLIDTNTIAELPEGVFYISGTLNLDSSDAVRQGIVGSGTGKTVICGLTDDFPLITVVRVGDTQARVHLANMTLQGGISGIYAPNANLISRCLWQYIIFRNQAKGIHTYDHFGLDNNFFERLIFVNCGIGFHNEDVNDLGYVDKTVFYKSQFINCDLAVKTTSDRACNLNAWIDCNFDSNRAALDLTGNRYPLIVNCDFTNNTGGGGQDQLINSSSPVSLYNCNFSSNSSSAIFSNQGLVAEGCNFLDNITLNSSGLHFDQEQLIYNCVVNGVLGGGWRYNRGMYVNSTFAQNPSLNKLIVNMNNNVITTIIDEAPNPYPQLLVKP